MPASLRQELGFDDGDAVYEALINAITGLDDQQAMKVMAKLILLLGNHIGDQTTIETAIEAARAEPSS